MKVNNSIKNKHSMYTLAHIKTKNNQYLDLKVFQKYFFHAMSFMNEVLTECQKLEYHHLRSNIPLIEQN